jgi:hypothetical protein
MGIQDIANVAGGIRLTVFSSDSPPVVEITEPTAGETIYGTVTVDVAASDDHGVTRVDLYADTVLLQTLTAPPFTFSLDTTVLTNGPRQLRAVVTDTLPQTAQASVSVIVDNIYAPAGFQAVRAVNRSLMLREVINVLTWADNPRNTGVLKFRIYRVTTGGRALVAEVAKAASGATYRYLHRGINAAETYAYEVVGVGDLDREGPAASATAR